MRPSVARVNGLRERRAYVALVNCRFGQLFGQSRCPMLSKTEKALDFTGGAERDRTADLLNAIQALSQTELQPHRVGKDYN